jgi:hypothetical protein
MFILKGFLVIILFIFALGLFIAIWLRYTVWKLKRKFNNSQNRDQEGERIRTDKTKAKPGQPNKLDNKGDYVDFEEVE